MTHTKFFIAFLGLAVTATLLITQSINAKSFQMPDQTSYIYTQYYHTYTYRVGNSVYYPIVPTYPFDPYNRNPFVNPTAYGFGPQAMKNFMGWNVPPTKIHSFDYYNSPKPSKLKKYGRLPANNTPTPTPTGNGVSQNAPHTDSVTDAAWRYCGAGDAFFIEGQYSEALENYQSAQRRKPGMPEIWVRKAICLFAMGEYTRAVDCIQNGVEQNPNWKLTDYTAFDNMYGKDSPELKAHMDNFRIQLKSNSKDPTLNYLAGVILSLQGHKITAKGYFKKATTVNKSWTFYVAPFQD